MKLRMSQIFFILIFVVSMFFCHSVNPKRLDCRKFVFAPACRGTGAKRDVRHHVLNEERRYLLPDSTFNHLDSDANEEWNKKNTKPSKGFLGIFIKKFSPTNFDYDIGRDSLYK